MSPVHLVSPINWGPPLRWSVQAFIGSDVAAAAGAVAHFIFSLVSEFCRTVSCLLFRRLRDILLTLVIM